MVEFINAVGVEAFGFICLSVTSIVSCLILVLGLIGLRWLFD